MIIFSQEEIEVVVNTYLSTENCIGKNGCIKSRNEKRLTEVVEILKGRIEDVLLYIKENHILWKFEPISYCNCGLNTLRSSYGTDTIQVPLEEVNLLWKNIYPYYDIFEYDEKNGYLKEFYAKYPEKYKQFKQRGIERKIKEKQDDLDREWHEKNQQLYNKLITNNPLYDDFINTNNFINDLYKTAINEDSIRFEKRLKSKIIDLENDFNMKLIDYLKVRIASYAKDFPEKFNKLISILENDRSLDEKQLLSLNKIKKTFSNYVELEKNAKAENITLKTKEYVVKYEHWIKIELTAQNGLSILDSNNMISENGVKYLHYMLFRQHGLISFDFLKNAQKFKYKKSKNKEVVKFRVLKPFKNW